MRRLLRVMNERHEIDVSPMTHLAQQVERADTVTAIRSIRQTMCEKEDPHALARITRAGTPAATTAAGTGAVTTAPAPMID